MRAVDFAVSRALPPDMRRPTYDLGKKGMAQLMADVASKYPDSFPEIVKKLGDLGRRASWLQGYTTGPEDTKPVIDASKYYAQMDAEIDKLRRGNLSPSEFDEQRSEIFTKYSGIIEKATMAAAMKSKNNFARAVASGARGNASHVSAILSTPGVYQDAKGNVIPLFIRNSFGAGMRPAETLAGTYGARTSVVSTKTATAKGGDLMKLMVQSALNYNVTEKDCGVDNGVSIAADDSSMRGRVLARAYGDVPAGTVIDKSLHAKLKRSGKAAVVRGAMTCRAAHGLCATCVGVQADGKFPNVGDSVGVTAAQAIGEPIVQGSLNCLVSGTNVRMADGSVKEIQDIKVGDMVVGADMNGKLKPTKVINTWDQGMQPAYRYEFKVGGTKQRVYLESTSEHKVLMNTKTSGQKEDRFNYKGRSIKVGYPLKDVAALPGRDFEPTKTKEVDDSFMVGLWLGDGIRMALGQECRFSCADPKLAEWVNNHRPDKKFTKRTRSHDYGYSNLNQGGVTTTEGVKNKFNHRLREWGIGELYCHDKFIPEDYTLADTDSLCAMIAGYTTADGSLGKSKQGHNFISWGSTSKRLLEDLKELLRWRLGILTSSVTRTRTAVTGCSTHDLYGMQVSGAHMRLRFLELVGPHIQGVKRPLVKEMHARDAVNNKDLYRMIRGRLGTEEYLGEAHCYDIEVANTTSLFLLENSLIVSNTKHNAGMAKGKKAFSGLDYITQFLQIPEDFKDRAAVSEVDGMVEKIEDAPQGGTFITVSGEKHFALPGFAALVKPGDNVEAGDTLSDGLVNPADIVRLKGLGAGRKYYAERLGQMLGDSGQAPDPRNVELLARSAIDSYLIDDPGEDDPWSPDELVRENEFLKQYKPAADTTQAALAQARNKYLQSPVLHYTVGTRVTPSVIKELETAGVKDVPVSAQTPWFKSDMKRLRTSSHDSKDWLASLGSSYLSSQMRNALEGAHETDVASNYHFGPRLAFGADAGEGNFGENIETTGKF